jgi:hypothetical protein
MSRLIAHLNILAEAHSAYRHGNLKIGLRNARFLLTKSVVRIGADELYALYESSIVGAGGDVELFKLLVEADMLTGIIARALTGDQKIVPELLGELGKCELDVQFKILTGAKLLAAKKTA